MECLIVLSTDDKYAKYAAVTITSILNNRSNENTYTVRVLHSGLSRKNVKGLEALSCDCFSVACVDIRSYLSDIKDLFFERLYYTVESFYRLLIPQLFSEYKYAVYIDCDLIVNKDIAEILPAEMGDSLLAAVNHPYWEKNEERLTDLGIDPYNYFNAGVLVINIPLWIRDNVSGKCYKILSDVPHEKMIYLDQDVLNIACKGRVVQLDPKWNYMWHFVIGNAELRESYKDTAEYVGNDFYIIHYTSGKKPWNVKKPLSEYWLNYAVKTKMYYNSREYKEKYGFKPRCRRVYNRIKRKVKNKLFMRK